ncbi:Tripartite tricarboxylate transporter family receptor [Pigmentiphaga humi]|uniref:Tripartite tricarboxylate transporter family receptor n=1 Tax=Pigmentiphaga humi TaxID=2478468 RepID=A0A3P4B503_9BURK|nr:tripartite tricarboxylate transporter substrate binding protein [Pigmentiphaga humi]VCU71001.1 Tripartite tricarboxylate transporter family receptor [Pigmentiphaga humi]
MPALLRNLGLAALAAATFASAAVQAEDYPARAVRIIAPFAAGTGPDANAREIAAELTKVLGQTVFVDNRPGASGIIGTEAAARAAADGYTLYIGTTSTLSVLPHLYSRLPFDVAKDFAPVSLLGLLNTGLIATPRLPAGDVQGLLALMKSKPESINVATQGPGSYSHLSGVWFGMATGSQPSFVPYNSNSPYADLLAGQVQIMFDGLPAAAGNIRAGKLKLLAITGKQRHPAFPDVPTFAEAGLADFEPIAWQGLLAPSGTPKAIVDKLSAAMRKAAQSQELAAKWRSYGGELKGNTPAEFAAFIEADRAKWGAVARQANVKLD